MYVYVQWPYSKVRAYKMPNMIAYVMTCGTITETNHISTRLKYVGFSMRYHFFEPMKIQHFQSIVF